MSTPPEAVTALPVGTYRLHDDVSINFQLHRWIAWTGGDALPDIRRIAPRLTDYATVRRLFLELAEAALAAGDLRRAAFTTIGMDRAAGYGLKYEAGLQGHLSRAHPLSRPD